MHSKIRIGSKNSCIDILNIAFFCTTLVNMLGATKCLVTWYMSTRLEHATYWCCELLQVRLEKKIITYAKLLLFVLLKIRFPVWSQPKSKSLLPLPDIWQSNIRPQPCECSAPFFLIVRRNNELIYMRA